ncbi:MAG: hypothetical protein L0G99_01020 [Propionibacteriales bacterium]|nr:hypothetical protein [Propionibacteriales bacterium]
MVATQAGLAAACGAAVITAAAFGMPSGAGLSMLAINAALITVAVGEPMAYNDAAAT